MTRHFQTGDTTTVAKLRGALADLPGDAVVMAWDPDEGRGVPMTGLLFNPGGYIQGHEGAGIVEICTDEL